MQEHGWAAARRLDYIDFRLATAGRVNRADIMRTFGVSSAQASGDLTDFQELYPRRMAYDASAKAYLTCDGTETVRGITDDVVCLIQAVHRTGHPMGWE
jgi:hypothetical protein